MNNIPYLAAHLEKRSGKEESFDIIKRAIGGEDLKDHDWAVLYSYFMPPKPKKITNPYEWLTLICDQNAQYAFCKYTFVEDGKIIAANTKTAHVLYDDLGLKPGWHDIKKGYVGDDVAIMPNVYEVLNGTEFEFEFKKEDFENGSFDIVDTPAGLSYVLPWNNKGVDKKYFDTIIKSMNQITLFHSGDGHFNVNGYVNNKRCTAVIMPFKINGFDKTEQTEEHKKEFEQLTF